MLENQSRCDLFFLHLWLEINRAKIDLKGYYLLFLPSPDQSDCIISYYLLICKSVICTLSKWSWQCLDILPLIVTNSVRNPVCTKYSNLLRQCVGVHFSSYCSNREMKNKGLTLKEIIKKYGIFHQLTVCSNKMSQALEPCTEWNILYMGSICLNQDAVMTYTHTAQ